MAIANEEEANEKIAWFLDSKCSNHMCGDKNAFVDLISKAKHFVKCRNDSRMVVDDTRSIRLVFNGTSFVIQDVYYVPELHKNFLSIWQLQERGLSFLIQKG